VDNNNKHKIRVEIAAVVSSTERKIGWAWTSNDSRIKPASGVIESPPAANGKEPWRDSNLSRYGEYVALKAFFADFLVALHGVAYLDVTDDPNVQKLLSARLRTCDDLDEVAEVEIAVGQCCSYLTGVIQEPHEALKTLWLSVVMNILYANLGAWVHISPDYEEDKSPAWHAARAALGLPPLPPRQKGAGLDDELEDLLQTRLSSLSDASASEKPIEETSGQQRELAEI